jgi:hypothetical protein
MGWEQTKRNNGKVTNKRTEENGECWTTTTERKGHIRLHRGLRDEEDDIRQCGRTWFLQD